MKKFFYDTSANLTATVVGGILLSLLFFIFSDFIFTMPDLNGRWTFVITTKKTSYNKFKGMKVYYSVFLQQQGENIVGTGEKLKDISGVTENNYYGKDRIQIRITGYLDKNYIAKDRLHIGIIEYGHARESSSFHKLIRFNDSLMEGNFDSTISDSSGIVKWYR